MGMRAYGPAPASRLLIELAMAAGITIHVGRHQVNAEKFLAAFGFPNTDAKKQMKNNFSSKTLKKGFAPLELVDAMVWEMLRILPEQHPSWIMHQSFACEVPDMVIIEASLARGWATREMQDWFSRTVTIEVPTVNLRPPTVWGEKTGKERRQDFLERHSDQVTLMIRDLAGDTEFATAVFFSNSSRGDISNSSRGDIFFGREAVEAAIPGIAYINSW
jgi:hypothetical protein